MRLILAHAGDASARSLADRWGDAALLLTPAALHRLRWRLELDAGGASRVVVGDRGGADLAVDAVICRLAGVTGAELPYVHRADRDYAAAELTAFLLAWLDACPVPVLNRPVAGSLNGPPWSPQRWILAAASVGLAVAARRLELAVRDAPPGCCGPAGRVELAPDGFGRPSVRVTLVGDAVFGPVHPAIGARLRELARLAGTPLLAAVLDSPGPDATVREVSAWPDLSDGAAAAALADLLDVA